MDLPYLYPGSTLLAWSSKLHIIVVEFQKLGSQKKLNEYTSAEELTKGNSYSKEVIVLLDLGFWLLCLLKLLHLFMLGQIFMVI